MKQEIKYFVQQRLNLLMLQERDVYVQQTGCRKNGFWSRALETENGVLNLLVPRCRDGAFFPRVFTKYQRQGIDFLQSMFTLLSPCMTMQEKQEIIFKHYGTHYSANFIRTLTEKYIEQEQQLRKKEIKTQYKALFLDGTYIKIKGVKKCLMVVIGITSNNEKTVLSYCLRKNESISTYRKMLTDLKEEGLEKVDIIISDGFIGMSELSEEIWDCEYQRCFLHFERTVLHDTTGKYTKQERCTFLRDFRKIVTDFEQTYQVTEKLLKGFFEANLQIFTYYNIDNVKLQYFISFKKLDKNLWKTCYTTNVIEGFNHYLKRKTKYKERFYSDKDLLNFVNQVIENSVYRR